jgi:hypothetical protein
VAIRLFTNELPTTHLNKLLLITAVLFALGAPAEAQDAAPGDGVPPARPRQAPVVRAPQVAPAAPTLADYARRDSTVATVLALPRQTVEDKFRAVTLLVDLGHTDVAALILPQLLQQKLDAKQQAALVDQFGSAEFLKLIRLDPPPESGKPPSLLSGARNFAQACLAAADAAAHDPARIHEIIANLNAPTEEQRYAARADLRTTGDPGIVTAFSALASATTEDARANILAALAEMRPAIDQPLLAVLADGQGQLRRDAAELAGYAKVTAAQTLLATVAVSKDNSAAAAARSALAKLGLPTPTPAEVEKLLHQKLVTLNEKPLPTTGDGTHGPWWSWNQAAKKLQAAEYAEPQLRTLTAARLTRALAEVTGLKSPADARLLVVNGLEEAALLGGQPSAALQKIIASMPPAELSAALRAATAANAIAAATQLIGELGRRGDASVLATSDGAPSPLAAALSHPVRAVRFAALSAIMQLAPTHSFPGSSKIADALWYFVAGGGDPAIVVAAPDIVQASAWAGQLRGHGFDATPTRTGREALAAAIDPATSSRLALVVLDSNIDHPPIGEVVYQLRTSDRTAGAAIRMWSSAPHLELTQRIAAANPRVLAVPRPHAAGALAALAEQAIALNGQPPATKQQRTAEAAQALGWLAKLLTAGSPYDELERDAALLNRSLYIPELSGPSLEVLASLRSADAQSLLTDYASSQTFPVEARRAAVAALAANVQRFGVQLTRAQILRQYDRYNASETADQDTQQVLNQLLDILEKKPAPPTP